MIPAARRAAAERTRKRELNRVRVANHRRRAAEKKAAYWVVIDGDVIDALVRWRWITDAETTDPAKVAKAIADGLKEAALNDLQKFQ